MRASSMATFVNLAKASTSPMGKCAAASIGAGFIQPAKLLPKLEEDGLDVVDKPSKNGRQVVCEITKEGALVASGQADDADDALLHAVLGALREGR